ncbi:MAG: HEAT repeat domain-containing protein [Gemmatimonadota bacterium]
MASVAADARVSREIAVALLRLVERLDDVRGTGAEPLALDTDGPALLAAREALRHLAARSREGAFLLRLVDGSVALHAVPMVYDAPAGATAAPVADTERAAALQELAARLVRRGVGGITIREGAAPGELLTLGRWLLRGVRGTPSGLTPLHSIDAVETAVGDVAPELLRTWSIVVTPAVADGAAGAGDAEISAAGLFARLAAARSDQTATAAVSALLDAIDDAESRGDAAFLERAARACVGQLRTIGSGAGRVAVETAIRRLLDPPMLQLLAGRLPHTGDPLGLLQLLARAGEAGVASLLRALLDADEATARRAYFDAIVAMDVGAAHLYETLRDERWYVVRNAAALLGEMGVEQADRELLPLLSHDDERIRIAAARALVRLRTIPALAGLHRVIGDGNPEVRRLAASAYGLSGTLPDRPRPPAGPLSAALDAEADDDVALEMLAALGRLGSSHAVQRLLRIALYQGNASINGDPPSPQPSWMRIGALEALVRARGHSMLQAIDSLVNDADGEVAAAAIRLRASAVTGARTGTGSQPIVR